MASVGTNTFHRSFRESTFQAAAGLNGGGAFRMIGAMEKITDGSIEEARSRIAACRELGSDGIQLDLSRLKLAKLPAEIGGLKAVRRLNLCDNGLTEFPVELAEMESLEAVVLFCNAITEIPAEIESLTRLKVLSISCNRLRHIAP